MFWLLRSTISPAMYHGFGKKPPYFEGWYYKLVSEDGKHRLAVVPGVILGETAHAFIQVLDGVSGYTAYHTFPIDSFWASKNDFDIRIGENRFTVDQVDLNISDEFGKVQGSLKFQGGTPWPGSLVSPGIMGWYAWVPRMECYHGVLSFDHLIQGSLQINQTAIDFGGGHGYIEKDWGQSFPAAWVWFQTNHFSTPGSCLTASVAIIPWMRSAFRGFIIGFWHQRQLFRFATYTGAKIEKLEIGEHLVAWVVGDDRYRLEMVVRQAPGGLLLGPTKVEMGKRVPETLSAKVDLRLSDRGQNILFEGQGNFAGLEVNGEIDRLKE